MSRLNSQRPGTTLTEPFGTLSMPTVPTKSGSLAQRRSTYNTNSLAAQAASLRISGQHYGYLATKNEYSNYRLVAEFKWGETTWAPRKLNARDSGVLVHGGGKDEVWPTSIECGASPRQCQHPRRCPARAVVPTWWNWPMPATTV